MAFGTHAEKRAEQVGGHGAGGRGDERQVPERIDAGAAQEGSPAGHDVDHVDLAEYHGVRVAELLDEVQARQVVGIGALDPGEIERGIDRNQHAAAAIDAVPEVVFAVQGHRQAIPEAQPAQVGGDEQVGLAAVLVAEIAFAGGETLVELRHARLHLDAMIREPGSTAAPVAGESFICTGAARDGDLSRERQARQPRTAS